MGIFRSNAIQPDDVKDRLAKALIGDLLQARERAKQNHYALRDALGMLNITLQDIGAGSDPKITAEHLDDLVRLEVQLRRRMDVPVTTLLQRMPGRLADWMADDVPPEGSRDTTGWCAEGIAMLHRADISPELTPPAVVTARKGFLWHLRGGNWAIGFGLAASAMVGLFPPWVRTVSEGSIFLKEEAGFAFLFNPPSAYGQNLGLDAGRLLIEWLCVWFVAGAAYLLFGKKRENRQDGHTN